MTLTAFRIANFKAFGASQRIPLRPITLIYGANSAGKSSVLHALALAHHAIETGDLDTHRPRIGGEAIDLGGFPQYVHRHDREGSVELAFELDPGRLTERVAELLRVGAFSKTYGYPSRSPERVAELLQPAREIAVELGIGEGITSYHQTRSGDRAREFGRESGPLLERFALEVDGTPLLSMSTRPGGLLRLDRFDSGHPVFRELFPEVLKRMTPTQEMREGDLADYLREEIDALVPDIAARSSGLFPRIGEDAEGWGDITSRGRGQEDLSSPAQRFLALGFTELVEVIVTVLENEIRQLRYLGPLRSYPPRHLAFSQHHDPNWFAGGGYAWDVVRTNEDVRLRVNRWLGDADRLKTPYELEVRDLLPASVVSRELPSKLHKALYDLAASLLRRRQGDGEPELARLADEVSEQVAGYNAANPDDIIPEIEELVSAASDEEALSERWAEELVEARPEALQDLVLIDKRTGTPVSHRDIGIGVSQVLPVLVAAYAWQKKLLAIEQPEIHLHPALQAELGDVFIESALGGGGNTFLIETHSEHLLLRILRRIRETTEGELPNGLPEVHPEQVSVLYVQPGREDTEVLHIPVTADGEFERPWPEGFFPERSKELF